jgi:two-component system LytT family sensor kinase
MRKARPRPGTLYWICQVGGWLSYALLCTFSSWLTEGHFFEYLVCSLVLAGCGLLMTHLLRGFIKRRRWLDLPPARLIIRVAAAIPVMGMLYLGCVCLTAPLYSHLLEKAGPFDFINQHLSYLFLDYVASLFTFACWVGIYIVFHFWKERRMAEKGSWRLAVALSHARLDVLRGQVCPHFLFNALKGLRGLIGDDPPQARDAVTRLRFLLRYCQLTDANATVPLGTEMNAVTDYLELESQRFEGRLRIHNQIQPEAQDRPIPRTLLQALVENAVKYGASQNPGIAELSIFAAIDPADGRLCIRVHNTGHLRMEDSCSKGTGLQNARERLHRLFGNDAELKIVEDPPGRVSVAVSVPNRRPTVVLPGS